MLLKRWAIVGIAASLLMGFSGAFAWEDSVPAADDQSRSLATPTAPPSGSPTPVSQERAMKNKHNSILYSQLRFVSCSNKMLYSLVRPVPTSFSPKVPLGATTRTVVLSAEAAALMTMTVTVHCFAWRVRVPWFQSQVAPFHPVEYLEVCVTCPQIWDRITLLHLHLPTL